MTTARTRSIDEVSAVVEAQNARKRMKNMGETDFVITISPLESFSKLVYTIEELLQEVTFEVISTDKFQGIRTDMANSNFVCVLKSKFAALVKLPPGKEKETFTVTTSNLKKLFKSAKGHSMDIMRLKGEDSLTVCCYGTPYEEYTLNTLSSDNVPDRLLDMETEYSLRLNTDKFKSFCKTVVDFNSEDLEIEIRGAGSKTPGSVITSYTILKCSTDANKCKSIYKQQSRVKEDGKVQFICDPLVDNEVMPGEIDNAKVLYNARFRAVHIINFLKNSAGDNVWASLAQQADGSPGPVIFEVALGGGDDTYMRLVQAPQVEDDDDE